LAELVLAELSGNRHHIVNLDIKACLQVFYLLSDQKWLQNNTGVGFFTCTGISSRVKL
jgi:hypothetical protein